MQVWAIIIIILAVILCGFGVYADIKVHKKEKSSKPAQFQQKKPNIQTNLGKEMDEEILKNLSDFDFGALGIFPKQKIKINFNLKGTNLTQAEKRNATQWVVEAINGLKTKIYENSENIKNYFLIQMLYNIYFTGSFDCTKYLKDKSIKEADWEKICSDVVTDKMEALLEKINAKGITTKLNFDAEQFIKTKLPFFDYDKFIKSIKLEDVSIRLAQKENKITTKFSMQLSDQFNAIFVSAYEQFDENLIPQDWHNF